MSNGLVVPSRPKRPLPANACDTHTHVFGPFDRFPLVITGSYEPPPTPFDVHRAMMNKVGSTRAVVVQPAPYAHDCSALVDACRQSNGTLRGIGVADNTISDPALTDMARNGVKGLRFVEVQDPQGGGRYRGSVGFDDFHKIAPRMKALGLHAQVWADADRITGEADALLRHGVPIVVDHIGRADAAKGLNQPGFQELLALLRERRLWVKLPVCRASKLFPDYPDARPLYDALIKAGPDRLLWGSDWPHVRMGAQTPDVGHLIDLFDEWIGHDDSLRQTILVENPQVLYGFA
jgi:2-pyrone-4,6-dicarboxylate lactonase